MATIAIVSGNTSGATTITKTTLTGTDDLLYKPGTAQRLVVENTGASTPTINIDGDLATTINCGGLGNPVDVSGGFDVALTASGTAGDTVILPLNTISAYLAATGNLPAVTGGTADVVAYIIEN